MAKEMSKEAPVAKLVMLHTMVGAFPQGMVVPATHFGNADIVRLLEIGALRHAKPEECECEHVNIDVHPSLSQKDAEVIEKLTQERNRLLETNDRLNRELEITRLMKAPPPAPSQEKLSELVKALADKDVAMASLQAQLAEARRVPDAA